MPPCRGLIEFPQRHYSKVSKFKWIETRDRSRKASKAASKPCRPSHFQLLKTSRAQHSLPKPSTACADLNLTFDVPSKCLQHDEVDKVCLWIVTMACSLTCDKA